MAVAGASADIDVAGASVRRCSAAVGAARSDARVLVFGTGTEIGGNAGRSTGYLAFADTIMQRAVGIEDSPEEFLDDMRAEITRQNERHEIIFEEALARRFTEGSAAADDYLVDDVGVRAQGLKITSALTRGRVAGRAAASAPPSQSRRVGDSLMDEGLEHGDRRMRIAVVEMGARRCRDGRTVWPTSALTVSARGHAALPEPQRHSEGPPKTFRCCASKESAG